MKSRTDYDVVIVGGGMVGATLACALGNTPLRVALVEARGELPQWSRAEYALRVSAITRASQNIFEALDIWPAIEKRRAYAFREMHVWDSSGDGEIHFDSAELGETHLGHIVENDVIVLALYERLRDFQNVVLLNQQRTEQVLFGAENASLRLSGGKTIKTSLIVAADGSNSWLRQQANIIVRGWDYDQSALVTYVRTEKSHQATAWQRFLPEGPLAFLPIDENISSIVWSTRSECAKSLAALNDDVFCAELSAAFEGRLGQVLSTGPCGVYPLRFFDAERYIQPRLALIGDAAHIMHPLAGQGVNLGLADVATLAEVLVQAQGAGRDPGREHTLRRYERWRKSENRIMLAGVDSFKHLYSSDMAAVRWLRNTGMGLLNNMGPLKQRVIGYAMGMAGDLPRLARGESLLP